MHNNAEGQLSEMSQISSKGTVKGWKANAPESDLGNYAQRKVIRLKLQDSQQIYLREPHENFRRYWGYLLLRNFGSSRFRNFLCCPLALGCFKCFCCTSQTCIASRPQATHFDKCTFRKTIPVHSWVKFRPLCLALSEDHRWIPVGLHLGCKAILSMQPEPLFKLWLLWCVGFRQISARDDCSSVKHTFQLVHNLEKQHLCISSY